MSSNPPSYQAEYRARNPEYMARQRQRQTARSDALKALREKHQKEFDQLFATELAKYGLRP